MAENTKIEWASHSFSPWIGCSRVHAGCVNCYAEAMAGRLGVTWGANGTRRRTAESTWQKVEAWNRKGKDAAMALVGEPQVDRPRVFPSLCDPFEDWHGPVLGTDGRAIMVDGDDPSQDFVTLDDIRRDFFAMIDRTPNLNWLLLTKRPENVRRMWGPTGWGGRNILQPNASIPGRGRENCWLLYSASDQATLDAGLPHLLACRDLVPVLGLSLEPLIEPVDLRGKLGHWTNTDGSGSWFAPVPGKVFRRLVDWVIVGGESGAKARQCNIDWIRSIARQCREAGVNCFVKQLGRRPICSTRELLQRDELQGCVTCDRDVSMLFVSDSKGSNPSEWPEDLRVQEFPR